jgi:glycosyltransferase involved in cell wall biosynthesis
LKLIWLSVAPYAPTGYGTVTRELVPRMINDGHDVTVACKHFHFGTIEWNGIKTIQGTDIDFLNRMIDRKEADYIISLLDNHALPGIPKKWISYTPFDTQKIPKSISDYLPYPEMIIALTRHGQSEIQKLGYECLYMPHGINTQIYYPDEAKRLEERKVLGWENNFIVGVVAGNYHDDRKNLYNLVLAFKKFHNLHDEARLFLSSIPKDTEGSDSLPMCIHNLGLDKLVMWTDPDKYYTGHVTDEMMANRYRGMDVMCLPTKGEGFGIPLIEAQGVGCPVLTTGASTGPELCSTQYLMTPKEDEWQWFNKEWRPSLNANTIFEGLERVYNDPERLKVSLKGYMFSKEYDWDNLYIKYWRPILDQIERLKTRVKIYPDYRKLYESFSGRFTMNNCGNWCKQKCFDKEFDLLPGENCGNSIQARSYPVYPDRDGKLLVDTRCPLHNWISKKFKKETKELWEHLWGFPEIRRYFDKFVYPFECIPLDQLKIEFNDEYKWAMQSQYYTNTPDLSGYLKGKVLEVGCGDGKRVKELRDRGIEAVGIEVNPAHTCEYVHIGIAEILEFDDDSMDVCYSVDVLEHLNDPLLALSEMFRVSKLVINSITPNDDRSFDIDPTHKIDWDRERWKREINEFGEIIDVMEPFTIVTKRRERENASIN